MPRPLLKGQIKMVENVAVMFVFFMLIGGGLIAYASFKRSSLEKKRGEIEDLAFIQTAERITALPDIACTQDNVPIANCVDRLKASSVADLSNADPSGYYPIFGQGQVILREVFPDDRSTGIYNYTCRNCSRHSQIQLPVSILSVDGTTAFGFLNITVDLP